MSELSVSVGNSDSTCGSGGGAERRRNRTDTRPPWKPKSSGPEQQPLALVFPARGDSGCRGRCGEEGAFPTVRGWSSRGGDAPRPAVPLQPLPEARTPGAQVWPGRQVQSALAPGRCPPSRPPLGLDLPPTFVYSSATAIGRQLEGCGDERLGGLGGRLRGPAEGNRPAGPRN